MYFFFFSLPCSYVLSFSFFFLPHFLPPFSRVFTPAPSFSITSPLYYSFPSLYSTSFIILFLLFTLKETLSRPPLRHSSSSSSLPRCPSTSSVHVPPSSSSTSFTTDQSHLLQPRHHGPPAPAPPPQHPPLPTSRPPNSGLSSWGHSGNILALHLHSPPAPPEPQQPPNISDAQALKHHFT